MSRPLSFHQIEAFRAVVISGTTVAAARMLHTTQPSISRLIGQAQSATGLKLFVNDRGRLQLTREGRHLFETVQLHFQGFERIEQTVAALRASGAGVFRIACTPSLALSILPRVLERFTQSRPQVHFDVQTLGSRQIEDGLRQGRYDVAITNNLLEGSEFLTHEVHHADVVCVASPTHAFAARDVVRIDDLRGQTLISLPSSDQLEVQLRKLIADRKVVPATTIETTYSSTICVLAAQGLGVGIVNPYMASVFKDRLCICRLSPKIGVTVYATFARFSPASELAERFLHELEQITRRGGWSSSQLATRAPSRGA